MNNHPVLGEFVSFKGDVKRLAMYNIKNLAQTSELIWSGEKDEHAWLDENGWERRISYLLSEGGVIYPIYLHIGLARDGRRLLYDLSVNINDGVAIDMDSASQTGPVVKIATPSYESSIADDWNNSNRNIEDSSPTELPDDSEVEWGFYVNDKTQPFTDLILDGEKTIETRTRRTLSNLIGQRVGLVRSGKGKSMLVGYVTIDGIKEYADEEEFNADRNAHRIAEDNEDYGWKDGKKKYGYILSNPVRLDEPQPITNKPTGRTKVSLTDGKASVDFNLDDVIKNYPAGSMERRMAELLKQGDIAGMESYINTNVGQEGRTIFSTPLSDKLYKELQPNMTEGQIARNRAIAEAQAEKYGRLEKPNENKPKLVVPTKDENGKKSRMHMYTQMQSKAVSEALADHQLRKYLEDEMTHYEPISNAKSMAEAEKAWNDSGSTLEARVNSAMKDIESIVSSGRIPKPFEIAKAEKLMLVLSENADFEKALKVSVDLAILGTELGQATQAFRIISQMTPTGQFYYMTRVVDRLNKQYEKQIAKGKMSQITMVRLKRKDFCPLTP